MATGTLGDIIHKLNPGQFTTLVKVLPNGALQARKLSTGAVKLYWRYTFEGKSNRVEIGSYDSTLPPKTLTVKNGRWSIAAAAAEASRLAQAHGDAKTVGGHAALMQAKANAEIKAINEATDAITQAQAEADKRSKFTLAKLAEAYWEHLKRLGRMSHRDAKSILTNHAIEAWPKLAMKPASEVTDEQIADMLRQLNVAGKQRTANKLRAYLCAAYEVARTAKSDPMIPVEFKGFAIRHNPAKETKANTSANKTDKNPLSADEMRTYWTLIKDLPGTKGAALRLHVLTGGQRIEQLVRLKCTDVTPETLTIFDGKGRPGQSLRVITLPITPEISATLSTLSLEGMFALSSDDGKTHTANTTLAEWARQTAVSSITDFQPKRVRSGVETLLASLGISKEIRGRLQSHGISGIQDRHYDAHDYMADKLKALEVLYREISSTKTISVMDLTAT